METKYWVQYRYGEYGEHASEDEWSIITDFITVGDGCEFKDLESWWIEESDCNCPHELLQVVKL